MRRFELNEKDAEFMNNYLWGNGYASMVYGDVIIASDDEDIEVKTILDDNNIKYTESNLHPDEILLEVSAQLDASADSIFPCAVITLVSGRCIKVMYVFDGTEWFFAVYGCDDNHIYYLRYTDSCAFDELHLITDYINEILDMENAQ